ASYGHYNLPRTLAPLTPSSISSNPLAVPTTDDLFSTGIMYEVPLFTGFAQQRSVDIATLEQEIAGTALKLSREQLIYNVKTLYVNILSLREQEKAQRDYQQALQKLFDDISHEVQLGKKARVEQLKAAADLEKARVRTRQINGNTRIVKATLASLLNIDTITDLEDFSIDVVGFDDADYSGQINELGRYRSAELDVEKKARLVEKNNAASYPLVSFNAFYGQNFGPNDSSNIDEGDWNRQEVWQATINLKWTIFDFGLRKANSEMATLRKLQSQHQRVQTQLELKRSLNEAATKIEIAFDEYRSAETELALTRETVLIEQTRFDNGAIYLNDLLYAKARDQLALSRLISAKYTYQNSHYYLDYLLEQGENK
ncbi:MAG: TolC family protein, partial [Gammaproteobacteria bacterium]|nr:TolC family protein [Gammaproteobacteria bacterium]